MDLIGGWVLPAAWGVLGLTIVVCGLLARRHHPAYVVGIGAVSLLWTVFGAGANVAMLLDGNTYTGFADGAPIAFVHDTWQSLVVPHHHLFIGLLVTGEALGGLLVLVPGRVRRIVLLALIAFNLTLVVFGWAFAFWGVPLATGLLLLRHAAPSASESPAVLRNLRRRPYAGASAGRPRSPRSRVPSP